MIKLLIEEENRGVDVTKQLIDYIDTIVKDIIDANNDGSITTREILGIVIQNAMEGFKIGNSFNEIIDEIRDLEWSEIVFLVEHSINKFDSNLDDIQKAYITRVIATISEIRGLIIDFDEVW